MSRFKFGDRVVHETHGWGVVVGVRPWPDGFFCDMWFAGGVVTSCDDTELQPYTPPAPAGTVPVRIAVAANDKREWRVRGANDLDDWTMRYHAADAIDGDCLITFITAHVPLPQPPAEVAGVVEGAEKC